MIMLNTKINKYLIPAILFIGMPLLFWTSGDFARRSVLKESLSILIILAFFLMLGQFFLTRGSRSTMENFRFGKIIKIHKYIGYIVVLIVLAHPFLIVLPRYFEAGVDPVDAFLTIISTFNSPGIVLGMVAWCLLLLLGLTALLRNRLGMEYRVWRWLHGVLSAAFIILGTWHAIDLGRHTDNAMSIYMIIVAAAGLLVLFRTYMPKTPQNTP